MRLDEFAIGTEFTNDEDGARRWRCTDVGSRVVVAIRIDRMVRAGGILGPEGILHHPRQTVPGAQAEAAGFFRGPPYAVAEAVFDEDDQALCRPVTMMA